MYVLSLQSSMHQSFPKAAVQCNIPRYFTGMCLIAPFYIWSYKYFGANLIPTISKSREREQKTNDKINAYVSFIFFLNVITCNKIDMSKMNVYNYTA